MMKPCTISELLRNRPALTQLTILQRADVMFRPWAGRYYGGRLSEGMVEALMKGLNDDKS